MIGSGDSARAWIYTRGMANALGLNLTAAVVDGWFTRTEMEALVTRCNDCGNVGECTGWLAQNPTATALPDYCPNKPGIEALAPEH